MQLAAYLLSTMFFGMHSIPYTSEECPLRCGFLQIETADYTDYYGLRRIRNLQNL
jgi:hypothetical protein